MIIQHKKNKIIILDDDKKEIGELKYKNINNEIVLMGTYINNKFRGNGYFNILLGELMKKHNDKVIYICCIKSFIFLSIKRFGFKLIDKPIPYWKTVNNGKNFKYTPL